MDFYPKLVLDIKGMFFVPAYQRGYRWGKAEVTRLLDDIYERVNTGQNYCLQPIVVKRIDDGRFELIDGQQRLTTLYLILKAIQKELSIQLPYNIDYQTRNESSAYLDSLDADRKNEYIDFRYIHDAFGYIMDWFGSDINDSMMKRWKVFSLLKEQVQVLWYEADDSEDSRKLFSRLNIGKIPLTNAELVKALFLNRGAKADANTPNSLQEQIAAQWDNMERELHNEAFWGFLSNADPDDYDTRLDLLFVFFPADREKKTDKYAIFFDLSTRLKEQYSGSNDELWRDIYEYFLRLREWFNDNKLYHRAGFISSVNGKYPLSRLINDTEDMGYDQKITYLDSLIATEVKLADNDADTVTELKELSYLNFADKERIEKILLLLNVRTMANSSDMSRFPFERYKNKKRHEGWSLEHIHAQHSEGLNKREQWVQWLEENAKGLEAINHSDDKAADLLEEIASAVEKNSDGLAGYRLTQDVFDRLRGRITDALSADRIPDEDLHSIANLALLGFKDNIVLSNSLFETKRQKIIDMDRSGVYVPVCTRNVFMKYYTPAGSNQPHFWGAPDRDAYLSRILESIYNIKND